jgi:PKD repeat protein
MYKVYSLLLILLITYTAKAQEGHLGCATDSLTFQTLLEKPEIIEKALKNRAFLNEFTKQFSESQVSRNGDPYIIPVVFHVIHNYGPENISDAQIYDGIEQANIQLRKLNADTTDIVDAFKSIAADTEIEIRLAQIDPNGNCTSGITRTVSTLTYIADHSVKSLIQWPPDKYLNIYVCNQAAGLAGHAMMPAEADTIPEWDGIVMQHSYVGTIGTSDPFRRTVLTHEIGHYLNLQHIWGGNNVPNYPYLVVAQPENCDYDDEVDDTPLTIGWQSCPLDGESCGSLDNVQNYMDYAYCARMFTEGQKLRMQATLNSPIAKRNNLWQPENLIATGTDGNNILCDAQFSANKKLICAGESIEFMDESYHGITIIEWSFEGGSPNVSSETNPSISYDNPGTYSVTLTAYQGASSVTKTIENYITVLSTTGRELPLINTFEGYTDLADNNKWFTNDELASTTWNINNQVGYKSDKSVWINNFTLGSGRRDDLTSLTLDASQTDKLSLFFDFAFARTNADNEDELLIYLSSNCGNSWVLARRYRAVGGLFDLNTTGMTSDNFIPNESQWVSEEMEIPQNYLVQNLMIRFQFRSGGGNNIYLDNINVAHPETVSGNLKKNSLRVNLFPNPAHDLVHVQTSESISGTIQVFEISGRLVETIAPNGTLTDINVSNYPSGIYLYRLSDFQNNISQTGRFSVVRD